MTWLVKNDDGEYLSEMGHGCVYWSEKQSEAHRFEDQGYAYRIAMKWACGDDNRVVKLKIRNPVTATEVPGPHPERPAKGENGGADR